MHATQSGCRSRARPQEADGRGTKGELMLTTSTSESTDEVGHKSKYATKKFEISSLQCEHNSHPRLRARDNRLPAQSLAQSMAQTAKDDELRQ